MSKTTIGKLTKIMSNENGTSTLEIVTIPSFSDYSERILSFNLEYDKKANNYPFSEGDLVKFDEESMSDLTIIPSNDFDYSELSAFVYEARHHSEDGIKKLHQTIMGLTLECDRTAVLADEIFMDMLLQYDYGKVSPIEMPSEYINFFNSEYVSNYYKTKLMEKVIIPNNIEGVGLDEGKALKDLTGKEWYTLYEIIDSLFKRNNKEYLFKSFFPLAFQIDSDGARDFLNNYADQQNVIRRLMNTSGLDSSASYYSGRGTLLCDLNQNHLFSLYLKLEKLNENKALAMAQLVYNMQTLGATEFINSLYKLAAHDYDLNESGFACSNVSVDGVNRDEALGILLVSCAGLINKNPEYNDYLTRQIKIDFINLLNEYLISKYLVDESNDIKSESDKHHLRLI